MSQILGNSINLPSGGGGKTQEDKSYLLTDNDVLLSTFDITPDTEYSNMEKVSVNTDAIRGGYPYFVKIQLRGDIMGGNTEVTFNTTGTPISLNTTGNSEFFIWLPIEDNGYLNMKNTGGNYLTTLPTFTKGSYDIVSGGKGQNSITYRIKSSAIISNLGSWMCIIKGTLITLANGTKKPIEDVTYDDDLLVWDFYNGCFTSAKPRWIKIEQTASIYNKLTFSNGCALGLVGQGGTHGYHRIFNKQAKAFTHTGVPETPNGTSTFAEDKTEPILVNQELVYKDVCYYNVITDKYFNIFANGILTSCSLSNQYKIENMKYIGDKLISDDEITRYFEEHKNLQLAQ